MTLTKTIEMDFGDFFDGDAVVTASVVDGRCDIKSVLVVFGDIEIDLEAYLTTSGRQHIIETILFESDNP